MQKIQDMVSGALADLLQAVYQRRRRPDVHGDIEEEENRNVPI